ncbi:serine/threonine-protein kinase [Haliangium sp.]|uniref:serine/threonine-protein kinase n=1 Tax=Haliangium sp. TaxID=2663208 RepID=UPI003D0FCFC3
MSATCPTCGKAYADAVYCPADGTPLVHPNAGSDRIGEVIGDRFRIMRKIGEGGIGEVFEAEHVYIHKRVALKLLRSHVPSRSEAAQRLHREARATSAIGHPNIVGIEDFGTAEDGQVFLAMEWLVGEPLDARLSRGPLSLPDAVAIVREVCRGLDAAHRAGVIHRDLKPENIFLARVPEGEQAKILDFGLAKLQSGDPKLTRTGTFVGTPYYIAPEQATGNPVDARADIYAVGVMLYELATGELPFTADTAMGVIHQHITEAPEPPRERAPGRRIPAALEAVVLRCMAKSPGDRYPSVEALAEALDQIILGSADTVAMSPLEGAGADVPDADPASTAPLPTSVVVHPSAHDSRAKAGAAGPAPAEPASSTAPTPRDGQTPAAASAGSPPAAHAPGTEAPPAQAPAPRVPTTPGPGPFAPTRPAPAPPTAVVGGARDRSRPSLYIALGLVLAVAVGAVSYTLVRSADDGDDRAADDDGQAQIAGDAGAAPHDSGGGRDTDSPRAWTHQVQAESFDFQVVVTPARTRAGQPITLDLSVLTAIDEIRDPLKRGQVEARLSYLYFNGHERQPGGAVVLSKEGKARTRVTLPTEGKYHVRLILRAGRKRLARSQFDLCVGADPGDPGHEAICPRMNR